MKVKNLLDDNEEIPSEPQMKLPQFSVYLLWSNIIVNLKYQMNIFKELQKIYEYTMKDWKSFGDQLVGQVEEEPFVQRRYKKYP